jgi:hypothetical protein
MNVSEVRTHWEALRIRLEREAEARKSSQEAVVALSRAYALLSAEERCEIDPLLSEWALSVDENKRFHALAIIADHRIRSALPALCELANVLERSTTPSGPYELAKVMRVMGQLNALSVR